MSSEVKLSIGFIIELFNDRGPDRQAALEDRRKRSRSSDSSAFYKDISFVVENETLKFASVEEQNNLNNFYQSCQEIKSQLLRDGREAEELTNQEATVFDIRWVNAQELDANARSIIEAIELPEKIEELAACFSAIPAVRNKESEETEKHQLNPETTSEQPRTRLKLG